MQYPDDSISVLFYKYIYKYEKIKVKKLTDTCIKGYIDISSQNDFDDVITELKKYCYQCIYKDNSKIKQHKQSMYGVPLTTYEFYFDKRTTNSTFINDLLRHIRNIIAHTLYNKVGKCYELEDRDGTRLTAYGHVKEDDLLKLIKVFVG